MSTAGKVLVILILVPTLLWVWLASGVAEMHRNWGKQLQGLETQITKAEQDIEATAAGIAADKRMIALTQRAKDTEVTARRTILSQLMRDDSYTKETLDRYTLQLSRVQDSVAAAEKTAQRRTQELADTKQATVEAQAELARLREENARDRETLQRLRSELLATVEQNRQIAEKANQAVQARTPSASNRREATTR
jgi:hypothetical protein